MRAGRKEQKMAVDEMTRQDLLSEELNLLALDDYVGLQDEMDELLDIDYFNEDLVSLADLDGFDLGDSSWTAG